MDLSNLLPIIDVACGLPALRERLANQSEPQIIGLSDAAKPAVIAALSRNSNAPVLIIVPKPPQALTLSEELDAWLGGALPVLSFPERDAFPYERIHPDPGALRDPPVRDSRRC